MADKTFTMRDRGSATDYDVRLVDNGDGTYSQGGAMLLVDESGDSYGVKHVGNKPRVSSMPYLYDIAEGNIAGHSDWAMLSFNGDVGTTEEDMWVSGGVYAWPAAGGIRMQVISTSGADDGDPAGTGVRTVHIHYLDDTYAERVEVVTTNGLTGVNTTATNIFRVNSFRADTIGTGGKAAGTISLTDTTPTVTYSTIALGYTRSRNGFYTVPLGKTLYVTEISMSVYGANKGLRFTFRSTWDADDAELRDFFIPFAEHMMSNGAFLHSFGIPHPFPAGTRLKISAKADQAGAVCSASMRGWLEE